MKFMKLLSGAAAAFCLLVGASGAAMAANNCDDGIIEGDVNDDIVINNGSCFIDGANVLGSIVVSNAETITIYGTEVSGQVLVTQSRQVIIVVNELEGNLSVAHNESATVSGNRAGGTTIQVNSNSVATVKKNISRRLICKDNIRLSALRNENTQENCQ
jgi:hypothetical protein